MTISTLENKLKELKNKEDVIKNPLFPIKKNSISITENPPKTCILNSKDLIQKPSTPPNITLIKQNIKNNFHQYIIKDENSEESDCNISKDLYKDGPMVNNVVHNSYNFTVKKRMQSNNSNQSLNAPSSPKTLLKIHNIIKANDPRNIEDVRIINSKIMFSKEATLGMSGSFGTERKITFDITPPKENIAQDIGVKKHIAKSSFSQKAEFYESDVIKKSSILSSFFQNPNNLFSFHSSHNDDAQTNSGTKSCKDTPFPTDYQIFQEDLKVLMININYDN